MTEAQAVNQRPPKKPWAYRWNRCRRRMRDAQLASVIRSGGGLVVTQVSSDGPSYERLADSNAGGPDIILRVNGQPTRTRAELHRVLASTRSGNIVMLTVLSRTADGWQPRVVRVRRQ